MDLIYTFRPYKITDYKYICEETHLKVGQDHFSVHVTVGGHCSERLTTHVKTSKISTSDFKRAAQGTAYQCAEGNYV